MNIGQRFAAMRADLGLNQTEMAEKTGVKRDSWRRYESGDLPTGETLERIALMGYSIDWLLTGRGAMKAGSSGDAVPVTPAGAASAELEQIPQFPIPYDIAQALKSVEGLLRSGPISYEVAIVNARHLISLIENKMPKS
jgi:transcriptional regulator with XRE-family HTH domain